MSENLKGNKWKSFIYFSQRHNSNCQRMFEAKVWNSFPFILGNQRIFDRVLKTLFSHSYQPKQQKHMFDQTLTHKFQQNPMNLTCYFQKKQENKRTNIFLTVSLLCPSSEGVQVFIDGA